MSVRNPQVADGTLQAIYGAEYYRAGHGGAGHRGTAYAATLSAYWRHELFETSGLDVSGAGLDFGAGFGTISAALPEVLCYDISRYAREALRNSGRTVVSTFAQIPKLGVKYILSSHSLEHCVEPYKELCSLREIIQPEGFLVLVLPFEKAIVGPSTAPDQNRHLYCWTCQTITNLLDLAGWRVRQQRVVYSPFGLRTWKVRLRLSTDAAVRLARLGSRLRRKRWGFLTVAEPK